MTCGPLIQISPDSPIARETPSSSLMAISMLGNGNPMLPLNLRLVTGLLVPMAQVSLIPQPSIMAEPVAASQLLAVPSDAAIPPAWLTQRLEKSIVLNCGCCNSALNSVLTAGSI